VVRAARRSCLLSALRRPRVRCVHGTHVSIWRYPLLDPLLCRVRRRPGGSADRTCRNNADQSRVSPCVARLDPASRGLRSRTIRLLCGRTEGLLSQTNAMNQASESRSARNESKPGRSRAPGLKCSSHPRSSQAIAWVRVRVESISMAAIRRGDGHARLLPARTRGRRDCEPRRRAPRR